MLLIYNINVSLIVLGVAVNLNGLIDALRDVRVKIPNNVRRGEKAVLKCYYDMEGDNLYSVKWYKGRREFYQYTPKENPPMKTFPIQGAKVNRQASNESQLTLDIVQLSTSGKYSCEVSADAPSFHTLIAAGELDVIETSNNRPVITGIRARYRVGDLVRANCTSRHSKPAVNLTWTINDREISPTHIRHHRPIQDSRKDNESAISSIQFVVMSEHFIHGKLKIRCSAHIEDLYWQSAEKIVEQFKYSLYDANMIQRLPFDHALLGSDLSNRNDLSYITNLKGDVSSLNSGAALKHSLWNQLTMQIFMFDAFKNFLAKLLSANIYNMIMKQKRQVFKNMLFLNFSL